MKQYQLKTLLINKKLWISHQWRRQFTKKSLWNLQCMCTITMTLIKQILKYVRKWRFTMKAWLTVWKCICLSALTKKSKSMITKNWSLVKIKKLS